MSDPLINAARRAGALVPEDVLALAAGLDGDPEAIVAELRRTKPQHFATPQLTDEEFTQALADGTLTDVINGTLPHEPSQPPRRPSVDLGAQAGASGIPRSPFGDTLGAEVNAMTDREFMHQLHSGELTRRLREG